MSETVRIFCEGMVPPSLNELRTKYRNHHAYARMRDNWRKMIWAMVNPRERLTLRIAANLGRRLSVAIHVTHKRYSDNDNLVGGLKPIIDCLKPTKVGKRGKTISTGLGFIPDDGPESIDLVVTQSKGTDVGTEIAISVAEP